MPASPLHYRAVRGVWSRLCEVEEAERSGMQAPCGYKTVAAHTEAHPNTNTNANPNTNEGDPEPEHEPEANPNANPNEDQLCKHVTYSTPRAPHAILDTELGKKGVVSPQPFRPGSVALVPWGP